MSGDSVERWQRRYERQKAARLEAESLLEQKSAELYRSNKELRKLTQDLETRVQERAQQLAEEESKFRTLFEESLDGIVIHDLQGKVSDLNDRMCRMLGIGREKALRCHVRDFHPASTMDVTERALRRVMEDGHAVFETEMQRADGSIFPVEIAAAVVKAKRGHQFVQGVVRDATKRREFEESIRKSEEAMREAKEAAERANQAKSLFLANMSHEIRTPMNGIIGVAELLATSNLTPEQADLNDTILMSGEALLEIINDILDLSKIESGKMDLVAEPFSLHDCVERSISTVLAGASKKQIELACLIKPDVPSRVVGDPTRLRQILSNLLGNAVKFTLEGEVYLRVSVEEGVLQFDVKDTGIGIAKADLGRLFSNFTQLDASTTRNFGGTGLGLAICRKLARLMGGDISVTSEAGEGSTFSVTIPLQAAEDGMDEKLSTASISFHGLRAVIVDDNATNRKVMAFQCRHLGMEVEAFASGQDALAWLEAEPKVDVAILDMQMPDMDGLMLARKIHALPAYATIPLVLATSLGNVPESESSREDWPFASKIFKPILMHHLEAAISSARCQTGRVFESSEDENHKVAGTLKILIAEDNPINLRVARNIIRKLGHESDYAHNGIEVLEKLKDPENHYDVILMDVQMPEMDGVETTARILEQWPDPEKRPRIIALTADALKGDRERFLAAGMDGYLSKPLRIAEIQNALNA